MACRGEPWRLGRRPVLDGLRGVAILLVLASHALPWQLYFGGGTAGVTLFFVLSGFLITTLILEEHASAGRVSLVAFYRRRAIRLLPALYAMVAVAIMIGAVSIAQAAPTLLYVGNFPGLAGRLTLLTHTWSLAIEEQFYLLWPPLLVTGLRWLNPRAVLLGTVGLASSSAVEPLALLMCGKFDTDYLYNSLDTRSAGILAGCALALSLHGRRLSTRAPQPLHVALLLLAVAACGVGQSALSYLVVPTLVAALTVRLLYVVLQGPYAGWLSWRPLTYIGQRSYGFYLWHVPLVQGLRMANDWPLWSALPMIALAWGVTELSWRFVEQPFQRRLISGRSRPKSSASPPGEIESAGRGVALTR